MLPPRGEMGSLFKWVGRHVGAVVSGICTSTLSTGILLYLAQERDIHPDKWVADMLKDIFGFSLTPYVWYFIVGASGLVGALAWEWIFQRRHRIAKADKGQASLIPDDLPEPTNAINIFDVFHRVQDAWKATPHSPPQAMHPMLYDRLRQGRLRCWGRPSRFYAPTMSQPWPLRQPIPKEFWEKNLIEDVEHWLEHRGWRQGSP